MIRSKQSIFLPALFIFTLSGCSNPEPKEKSNHPTQAADPVQVKSEVKDHSKEDTTVAPLKILTTGVFHNDEIWSNASKMKWIGLFKDSNGYYLKNTQISIIPAHDPVFDNDESIKTGWEVSSSVNDTNLVFMEALPYLTNRKINAIPLSKNEIYPGDHLSFQYLGVDYELFATGNKKKESEAYDWYIVSNYKLYLTAKIKGKLHKTLLASHELFREQMVSLIFIGDLDGDGIVDVLLNNSNHYNATDQTLYFSRPANKGQVVKKVGSLMSFGC